MKFNNLGNYYISNIIYYHIDFILVVKYINDILNIFNQSLFIKYIIRCYFKYIINFVNFHFYIRKLY